MMGTCKNVLGHVPPVAPGSSNSGNIANNVNFILISCYIIETVVRRERSISGSQKPASRKQFLFVIILVLNRSQDSYKNGDVKMSPKMS